MRFTIEAYATGDDGAETLIHRATVSALTPLAARTEANSLLRKWKKATAARVVNAQGEVVYNIGR